MMFAKEDTERETTLSDAFPQFTLLNQLGHYTWNPGHNSNEILKSYSEVTVLDVTARLPRKEGRSRSDPAEDVNTLFELLSLDNG